MSRTLHVRSPRKSLAVAKQEIAFYLAGIDFLNLRVRGIFHASAR